VLPSVIVLRLFFVTMNHPESFVTAVFNLETQSLLVTVPWNEMDTVYWELAAGDAGDADWHDTQRRAWTYCTPEAIRFVFRSGELQVQYILPTRGYCGWGYKGYGMTEPEKLLIEEYYTEVEDSEDPYVYIHN
jgi:hypothetical protein